MFHSLQEICARAEKKEIAFWDAVLQEDAQEKQIDPAVIFEQMGAMYQAMKDADASYDGKKSSSGMVGTDGKKLEEFHQSGDTLLGDFLQEVMERAIRTGECNACMKRIVAAPTAGSCGVLPAVLLSYEKKVQCGYDQLVKALFVAAGIGEVIADRASIAGAQGGCQAEIGSASAMAAGAVVYLQGGSSRQIIQGAAIALKGLLGLVCDPVGGLVEVPCIKRNVIGAVNAVTSADMALAGIESVIPPDEVIDAMDEIGRNMSTKYRETSEGGLAVTPTAQKLMKKLR